VWDWPAGGPPRLLRPDYFHLVNGRPVDFDRDYYRPFAQRFAAAIRSVDPRALIFLEGEAGGLPLGWRTEDAAGVVFAPHWYDGLVLITKRFSPLLAADSRTHRPVFLPGAIHRSFAAQLGDLKRGAQQADVPVLLGEFGIPFDLEDGRSYRDGDFTVQIRALDRSFQAPEANLLSGTLWNYTADNSNATGDGWNGEDLSIFSRDQQSDPSDIHSGGRGLPAVVRPYPHATAGELLRLSFDVRRRIFEFHFRHDPAIGAPTEIFVPNLQYPQGYQVEVSDGTATSDPGQQRLTYQHTPERAKHTLRIKPRPA